MEMDEIFETLGFNPILTKLNACKDFSQKQFSLELSLSARKTHP
jgi:hypothetical protein